MANLIQKLGLADAMRTKTVLVKGGSVGDVVAAGGAEIAFQQISELLPIKGLDVVGPLPEAVQNYTTYAAAIAGNTKHRAQAQDFLKLLSGPQAAAALKTNGMVRPKG